jgi:glycosyltransferase involved in cell wall biosynthesis
MFISVVTCTRDRAASLARLLASFARLNIPEGVTWEVVIVDNASTDGTAALIDSFAASLPIRRVTEPIAGVAPARNRGVTAAAGDYILWTDDDCEADPNWLAAYAAAFKTYPDAALFAGRIVPVLEEPVTPWFAQNLDQLAWLVAARDFGPADRKLSTLEDILPFGANAALRAAEQRKFGYDPSLGVKLQARMVGEEMKVFRAILESGQTGIWVPAARIDHHITRARQSASYVRKYFFGHGEFGAHRALQAGTATKHSLLLHHAPRAVGNFILYSLCRPILPPRYWLRRLTNLGSHLGALDYAWRHSAQKPV